MTKNKSPVRKCFFNFGAMLTLVAALTDSSFAAVVQTQVSFDSGSTTISDQSSVLLTPGTAADGNGAVIQLGYYDGASAGNNFVGTWHALTGMGSLNTGGNTGAGAAFNTTSIGDSGGGAAPGGSGVFGMSLVFDSSVTGTFNDLPSSSTIPLAIKFFNGTTVAGSTNYNVVSDNSWLWKTPATPSPLPPTVTMSLDDPGLTWQSGVGGAFKTSLAISAAPEPSRILLLLAGFGSLLLRRRKAK
jgi:hypothetical protein